MKRRNFLKLIGASSVTPGILVAKPRERPRDFLEDKIFNGQVFRAPWPLCHTVIVQYFGRGDKWLLLSSPYRAAQHQGNAMTICYYGRKDGSDNPLYTQRELQEKLKNWKLVKSRLILGTDEDLT